MKMRKVILLMKMIMIVMIVMVMSHAIPCDASTGSAFEERLEAAAALDLSVIKAKLSQSDGASDRPAATAAASKGSIDEEYNKDLKQMRMTWSELNDLERRELRAAERFQLNSVERINLTITCLLTSFAWGNYHVIHMIHVT